MHGITVLGSIGEFAYLLPTSATNTRGRLVRPCYTNHGGVGRGGPLMVDGYELGGAVAGCSGVSIRVTGGRARIPAHKRLYLAGALARTAAQRAQVRSVAIMLINSSEHAGCYAGSANSNRRPAKPR
jgi:hypothetical protein